ncbi:hypothetical protein ACTHGU_16435 [Chitinophagaceae bacterium MMS25-I14]
MKQLYDRYTAEDQQTWNTLFERQVANLPGKAAALYLSSLKDMKQVLSGREIPHIDLLNEALHRHNGWQIHIVPGLIPAGEFLSLLAEKKFCSSTWLRSFAQLDYLEEPDMFHDIFGHVPLLWDKQYADFVQQVGMLGRKYADNTAAIALLERFYWFTIEFGLIREKGETRIYGAGIMSSFLETNSIYAENVPMRPFALDAIAAHDFVKSELQAEYFIADSFEQLYDSLRELEVLLQECIAAAA